MSTLADVVTFGGGTATELASMTTPVLLGVMLIETDTGVIKIGDGISLYQALPVLTTVQNINTTSSTLAKVLLQNSQAITSLNQANQAAIESGAAAVTASQSAINALSAATSARSDLNQIVQDTLYNKTGITVNGSAETNLTLGYSFSLTNGTVDVNLATVPALTVSATTMSVLDNFVIEQAGSLHTIDGSEVISALGLQTSQLFNAGTVSALGPHLNLTAGTLDAIIQTQSFTAGTVTSLGSNLSLTTGTLSAVVPPQDFTAGVVSAIGSNLILNTGTLNAITQTQSFTAGDVSILGAGLNLTTGTLSVIPTVQNFTAGTVSSIGTHLTINAGTLDAIVQPQTFTAGLVSALGPHLSLSTGTLDAIVPVELFTAGSVSSIGANLALNLGTLSAIVPPQDFTAGNVSVIGSHLTLNTGTLASIPNFSVGTVTSLGGNLALIAGTLNAVGLVSSLHADSDVLLTNPIAGDILQYNGTDWINRREKYIIGGWIPGSIVVGQTLASVVLASNVTWPANFGLCDNGATTEVKARNTATAQVNLAFRICPAASDPTVVSNFIQQGTIITAASGYIGQCFTNGGTAVNGYTGDCVDIVLLGTVTDVTYANVQLSIAADT